MNTELIEALDNFQKARQELNKFTLPFTIDVDGEYYTLSCPTCGTIFGRGDRTGFIHFDIPIICCDKILQ